jgi:hypothetical protein
MYVSVTISVLPIQWEIALNISIVGIRLPKPSVKTFEMLRQWQQGKGQ